MRVKNNLRVDIVEGLKLGTGIGLQDSLEIGFTKKV